MRSESVEFNAELKDGTYQATVDPLHVKPTPKAKPEVPVIDFTILTKAVTRLKASATQYSAVSAKPSVELDAALIKTERSLLGDGLPRRPWYKHAIYAPGFFTGYGVKTLPAIREALEEHNWTEAKAEMSKVAGTLDKLSEAIEKAAKIAAG